MIVVHHLNNSRSQRVLWLLEELGLKYQVIRYERDPQTMLAPESLRKIHPLGKSPVITDAGQTIAESGAIIEYLLERYADGRLQGSKGSAESIQMTYWLHYAEGSLMSPLLLSLIFARMPKQPMPFFVRPIVKAIADKALSSFVRPQLSLHFNYMEAELKKHAWFAGNEFTAADIQMSFPVEAGRARGALKAHPKLLVYLERIHERPAYQAALAKGGPYDLLF